MGRLAENRPVSRRKANRRQRDAGPNQPRRIDAIEKLNSQARIFIANGGTPPGQEWIFPPA